MQPTCTVMLAPKATPNARRMPTSQRVVGPGRSRASGDATKATMK